MSTVMTSVRFFKNHGKLRTEIVVELITSNCWVQMWWGLLLPHRWTTRQIYWEILYYPFLDHKLLIDSVVMKNCWEKIDKMQINSSHRQLSWSFSWVVQKCERMSFLDNKSEIVFLAFTEPYLKLFLQLPFSWQKSCVVAQLMTRRRQRC